MNSENFKTHFPNRLIVAPKMDAKNWRLESDFLYITTEKLGSKEILVKEGFVTDFASVPIPIRSIIPKWGKYGRASVIHDWLYYKGDSYEQDSEDRNISQSKKEFADQVLLDAMEVSEVNCFVRLIIYKAVDWFGIFAWLSNKVKKDEGMEKMEYEEELVTNAYSSKYLSKWKRSIRKQIPDMWKEWKNQKRGKP